MFVLSKVEQRLDAAGSVPGAGAYLTTAVPDRAVSGLAECSWETTRRDPYSTCAAHLRPRALDAVQTADREWLGFSCVQDSRMHS